MQWGAHWVSPDGAKAICNSPEMIQALSSYLDIVVKDKTTTISPGVKLSASRQRQALGGWGDRDELHRRLGDKRLQQPRPV